MGIFPTSVRPTSPSRHPSSLVRTTGNWRYGHDDDHDPTQAESSSSINNNTDHPESCHRVIGRWRRRGYHHQRAVPVTILPTRIVVVVFIALFSFDHGMVGLLAGSLSNASHAHSSHAQNPWTIVLLFLVAYSTSGRLVVPPVALGVCPSPVARLAHAQCAWHVPGVARGTFQLLDDHHWSLPDASGHGGLGPSLLVALQCQRQFATQVRLFYHLPTHDLPTDSIHDRVPSNHLGTILGGTYSTHDGRIGSYHCHGGQGQEQSV